MPLATSLSVIAPFSFELGNVVGKSSVMQLLPIYTKSHKESYSTSSVHISSSSGTMEQFQVMGYGSRWVCGYVKMIINTQALTSVHNTCVFSCFHRIDVGSKSIQCYVEIGSKKEHFCVILFNIQGTTCSECFYEFISWMYGDSGTSGKNVNFKLAWLM